MTARASDKNPKNASKSARRIGEVLTFITPSLGKISPSCRTKKLAIVHHRGRRLRTFPAAPRGVPTPARPFLRKSVRLFPEKLTAALGGRSSATPNERSAFGQGSRELAPPFIERWLSA